MSSQSPMPSSTIDDEIPLTYDLPCARCGRSLRGGRPSEYCPCDMAIQTSIDVEAAKDRPQLPSYAAAALLLACAAGAIFAVCVLHAATNPLYRQYTSYAEPSFFLRLRWAAEVYLEPAVAVLVFLAAFRIWKLHRQPAARASWTRLLAIAGPIGALAGATVSFTVERFIYYTPAFRAINDGAQILFQVGLFAALIAATVHFHRRAHHAVFNWHKRAMSTTFGAAIFFETCSLLACLSPPLEFWMKGIGIHLYHEWTRSYILLQFLAFIPLGGWFLGYHLALKSRALQSNLQPPASPP